MKKKLHTPPAVSTQGGKKPIIRKSVCTSMSWQDLDLLQRAKAHAREHEQTLSQYVRMLVRADLG